MVLGLFFALIGIGFIALVVVSPGDVRPSVIGSAFVVSVFAFIGLFGAGMVVQGLRGRPTGESFFLVALARVARRTSPASLLLGVAAAALVSLILGFVFGSRIEVEHASFLLGAWLAFHIQILFHELGHYSAAFWCGYRPFHVVGGAFSFDRHARGWTRGLNRDWHFLVGGAVFYEAPAHARTWTRDFLVVASGPAATLFLLVVISQLATQHAALIARNPILSDFVDANAALGTFALLLNLLPVPVAPTGIASDGYQLMQLLRSR